MTRVPAYRGFRMSGKASPVRISRRLRGGSGRRPERPRFCGQSGARTPSDSPERGPKRHMTAVTSATHGRRIVLLIRILRDVAGIAVGAFHPLRRFSVEPSFTGIERSGRNRAAQLEPGQTP